MPIALRSRGKAGFKPSQDFIDNINNFGLRMHSFVASPDKPTAVCGMTMYQTFLMAGAGSSDRANEVFFKALGLHQDDFEEEAGLVMQLDGYCKSDTLFQLASSRSAWYHPELVLDRRWAQKIGRALGAKYAPLRVEEANEFVESKTMGKIPDAVLPDSSDVVDNLQRTALMLITSLAFRAIWEEPFDVVSTFVCQFNTFAGGLKVCSMMHKKAVMDYMEDKAMQVCVLPYMTDDLSVDEPERSSLHKSAPKPIWRAAVILPKEIGFAALKDMLFNFSQPESAIRTLITKSGPKSTLEKDTVELLLPRFVLRLRLDMSDTVGILNLTEAFTKNSQRKCYADSPLSAYINHEVFIEVNENGTEMPSTFNVGSGQKLRIETHRAIVANRPFLFLVFDELTKLVLFSAAVCEPSQQNLIEEDSDSDSSEEMSD
jgi:serine protease inhibitor